MRTIAVHRTMDLRGWEPMAAIVIAGWFGAVRGTSILSSCDRLAVAGAAPMMPTKSWVFVLPGFFDLCSLCFCPLRGAGA